METRFLKVKVEVRFKKDETKKSKTKSAKTSMKIENSVSYEVTNILIVRTSRNFMISKINLL